MTFSIPNIRRVRVKPVKMSDVPAQAIWRQILALIPVYMNVFMMGCGIGWLPNAIYFLLDGEEVRASASQCALIASFSEFGRIIFAIPAGILTDKYGRKKIIISIALLHFCTWLGISLNTSLLAIYIGRLIIGVAASLVNAIALISIGEIASSEVRGQLTSIYQIFMTTGAILPSMMTVIFLSYKLLSYGITFLSIITLITMLWVSETPSFLLSISQFEQAKNNLRLIRQGYEESQIDTEFEKLKKYIEDEKIRKSQLSWLKFLKSQAIRKPLLTGILLNFFSVLTGAILISVYITALYPANDYVPKKYYPLMGQILYLFIAIVVTFYIDKFPRRTIFMIGAATMTVTNAFCAFASYFNEENEKDVVFKSIFIVGNILSTFCYGASVQPINSAIKSELYPQAVKGFCAALGVISQSSAMIIMFQLYPFFKNYFHVYLIYIIFSINSFILYLVIYFLLPEGRGNLLSDLQMKFNEEMTVMNK